MAKKAGGWKSRIVGHGKVSPERFAGEDTVRARHLTPLEPKGCLSGRCSRSGSSENLRTVYTVGFLGG
jgi:hypothetical protein